MQMLSKLFRSRYHWKLAASGVSVGAAALYVNNESKSNHQYAMRHKTLSSSEPTKEEDSLVSAAITNILSYLAPNSIKLFTDSRLPNPPQLHTGLFWAPPSREDQIKALKNDKADYDILVIGGGATGAGVALDAATRGLKVALVERDDFASGASSKSTKLVHGGVRYLEKAFKELDYEQYKLVREALYERATFLKIAPHLSYQLPIMLPVYKWWKVPYFYVGAKFYDIFAGKRGLESSYFLNKSKALECFPMLKTNDLAGAVVYYDGAHNDSRMNVSVALTAAKHGAVVANHVEVVELIKENVMEKPFITGAVVRDVFSGDQWTVKAKGVINATGPFSDSIRKMGEHECKDMVAPSAGAHVTLPDYYSPDNMGLLDPETSDGRVIFFLPWQGHTIAGTTDSPVEITDKPKAQEQEIRWILSEVSRYFNDEIKVRRGDVLAAWSGIRPLVRNPRAKKTEGLVRNHIVHVSDENLITIAGGKWTTYRNMAQETVDTAIKTFGLTPKYACKTEDTLLVGAQGYSRNMYIKLIQQFGIEIDVAKHLAHSYGDHAFTVLSIATPTGVRWPVVGKRIATGYPYLQAEVRYACRHEYACTLVDVIARRTRLAFLNAQAADDSLEDVASIMATELGWSEERKSQEINTGKEFLLTMGFDSYPQAEFNAQEIILYRDTFAALDANRDGSIGLEDLEKALKLVMPAEQQIDMTKLGKRIIQEVDKDGNGIIEFNEFLEVMAAIKHNKPTSQFADLIVDFAKVSPDRSGGGV